MGPTDGAAMNLVTDIVDTGRTLSELSRQLLRQKPRTLRTAALVSKSGRRDGPFDVDYHGGGLRADAATEIRRRSTALSASASQQASTPSRAICTI